MGLAECKVKKAFDFPSTSGVLIQLGALIHFDGIRTYVSVVTYFIEALVYLSLCLGVMT